MRLSLLALASLVSGQTWTSCNPLTSRDCPSDPALGMSINVNFNRGEVSTFMASGNTEYDSDGVHFTIKKSGDAPQLASAFYIMFGRVSVTLKAAPGRGIVSSVVLQSDTLDEIDFEWIGTEENQVQTNYYGKGIVSSGGRGGVHPADNAQTEWHTYTIDWTKERILWIMDGAQLRELRSDDAPKDPKDQYPQTPMQIKFGTWSGGDPSRNGQGTVDWAGGQTDFNEGPFTMHVQSIVVSDYSTGKEYRYKDDSGSWESIEAVDGEVSDDAEGDSVQVTTTLQPISMPTGQGMVPKGGIREDMGESTRTQTGWPWVAGSTPTRGAIPDGWHIDGEGKVVPDVGALVKPTLFAVAIGGLISVVGLFL